MTPAGGVLLGLVSAVLWGVADFGARMAAHQAGAARTLLYLQCLGLLALAPLLLAWPWPGPPTGTLVLTVVIGLSTALGAYFLYQAFVVGSLAIVSPIAASGNAIAVMIALAAGERPTAFQLSGIVVTLLGVVLASADPSGWRHGRWLHQGAGLAGLAALCFGFSLWAVAPAVAAVGPIWATALARTSTVVGLLVIMLLGRSTVRPPATGTWRWLVPVALMDVGAQWAYSAGTAGAYVSLVAVASSLFSVVTVVLARITLGEKLALGQWLGVGLVFVGVVLVGWPGPGAG